MLPKLLLIASLQFVLTGCVTIHTTTPPAGDTTDHFRKPSATKVVLVVLENTNPDKARDEQFLGRLAASGAYLSNYYAVAHPSQPNYVALISGSTKGVVHGDLPITLDRPHLGQKLSQKLQSWMTYAEGYPGGKCNLSTEIGRYARKHVPFLSFKDVQDDKVCRDHITGINEFVVAAKAHNLPSFSLVIPDLDHDAHDKPLRDADAWLEKNFFDLIHDVEFRRDVLLIVTFDENATKWPYFWDTNNKVFTVIWGDDVIPGDYKAIYNHYDLHRTIEAIFDLPPNSTEPTTARPIGGIWRQRK